MKTIFTLITLTMASVAHSNSRTIFPMVDGVARVFVESRQKDQDAANFFNMMMIPSVSDSRNEKKMAVLKDRDGVPFEITCSMSLKVKDFGVCYLQVRKSRNSKIDPVGQVVEYRISDRSELAEFLNLFKVPPHEKMFYVTIDGRFTMTALHHGEEITEIVLQYQE